MLCNLNISKMLSQNLSATLTFKCCLVKRCLRKLFTSQERFLEKFLSTLSCSLIRQRFFHLPHFQSITPMQKQQKLLSWERRTQNTFFSFLRDFTAGNEDSQHSLTCYSSKGCMHSASGSGTAAALGLCPFCLPYLPFCHLLIFHFYGILFW